MLAYRHLFHAGGFSDVFKHALLARLMLHLNKKDKPYLYPHLIQEELVLSDGNNRSELHRYSFSSALSSREQEAPSTQGPLNPKIKD